MKTTRKRYSAEFKAKVAMEAIRGDLTLAELAAKHGVHHTMIGAWKRQAMDGMASEGGCAPARSSRRSRLTKLRGRLGRRKAGNAVLPHSFDKRVQWIL